MPTYEYECTKCGHLFEAFQQMTAEPIKKCPECACRVKRLFGTGAGLLFKGGGFYETDYRSEGYKKAEKKEAESHKAANEKKSDSTGKKSEKKSESKPTPSSEGSNTPKKTPTEPAKKATGQTGGNASGKTS
jgi:putative FmdB family regulatory protein